MKQRRPGEQGKKAAARGGGGGALEEEKAELSFFLSVFLSFAFVRPGRQQRRPAGSRQCPTVRESGGGGSGYGSVLRVSEAASMHPCVFVLQ